MRRKFFWRKFFLFRLFRSLPAVEREHVMSVLPKKHRHQIALESKTHNET